MSKESKCKHTIVHLQTRVKPHIWACTKCKTYQPKKHPSLTKKEILVLIDYVASLSKSFEKKKS